MADRYSTGFKEHYYNAPDGLKLYAREYGGSLPNRGTPIVCLPGLTRNSADFHLFAMKVSTHPERPRQVFTFDLRGRGRSAWDEDKSHYDAIIEAQDVIAGCHSLGIEKAAFIGTSRGGLVIHVLAAIAPQLIAAVVLNDVGPVIAKDGLSLIQAYLKGPPVKLHTWEQAVAGLKMVHGKAFDSFSDDDWTDMAHASLVEGDGGLIAPVDPAIGQAMAALDLSKPLPELWEQFDILKSVPVMTIRGSNSMLLSQAILDDMKARNPAMKAVVVEGQGHAPFLHMAGLDNAILDFLDTV